MTSDHRTTHLHVADLEREIETIRAERSLRDRSGRPGLIGRVRSGAGRVVIAAGEAIAGRESGLRTRRI